MNQILIAIMRELFNVQKTRLFLLSKISLLEHEKNIGCNIICANKYKY